MYVALYPTKEGRRLKGIPRTVVEAPDDTALGVRMVYEINEMMKAYKKTKLPYDGLMCKPIKKPTRYDRKV